MKPNVLQEKNLKADQPDRQTDNITSTLEMKTKSVLLTKVKIFN